MISTRFELKIKIKFEKRVHRGEKLRVKDYNIVFPYNIMRLIKELGLKNAAVAERVGYSKQQFSDMLNGRKIIKPCDALAIANVLGVTMNDLYEIPKSKKEVG